MTTGNGRRRPVFVAGTSVTLAAIDELARHLVFDAGERNDARALAFAIDGYGETWAPHYPLVHAALLKALADYPGRRDDMHSDRVEFSRRVHAEVVRLEEQRREARAEGPTGAA